MLDDGVVVVARLGELEHVFPDVSPLVRIAIVTLTECHRIANVVDAAVVGSQYEISTLTAVANVEQAVFQLC